VPNRGVDAKRIQLACYGCSCGLVPLKLDDVRGMD
jgi:hypothetical protein